MIQDASIYTTASPCWNCFKLVVNSGMRKIYFGEFYRDDRIFNVAGQLGIELVDLSRVIRGVEGAKCHEAGHPDMAGETN